MLKPTTYDSEKSRTTSHACEREVRAAPPGRGPVANIPTGTDETSGLIIALSHTLYTLLATLATRRSLGLLQIVAGAKRVRKR